MDLAAPTTLFGVTQGRDVIRALDGVRALAASLVFLVHYHAAYGALLPPGSPAHRGSDFAARVGYYGVELFFVLSGYLIYGALIARETPLPKFLTRRVRRIYPTFLAVLALYLAIMLAMPSRSKLPGRGALRYVLENVLLLPGVLDIEPIVTVAWSLSFEIFFYLGVGIGVTALGMRRWPRSRRVAALCALGAVWVVLTALGLPNGKSFIMFLPGMLLYEWRAARGGAGGSGALDALALAVLAAVLLSMPGVGGLPPGRVFGVPGLTRTHLSVALLGASIAAFLYCAMRPRTALGRAFEWTPLRYVGLISYSFYLIHGLTINTSFLVVGRLVGAQSEAVRLAAFLVALPFVYLACVAASTVLFVLVERRFSLGAPATGVARGDATA